MSDAKNNIHPAAYDAMTFVKDYMANNPMDLMMFRESLASCSIEGNDLAEVCGETLDRLLENKPVGSQYILGLAWFIKDHVANKGYKERYANINCVSDAIKELRVQLDRDGSTDLCQFIEGDWVVVAVKRYKEESVSS